MLGFQQSWTIYAYVAILTNKSKVAYSMLHAAMTSCLRNVYYGRPKSTRTPANVLGLLRRLLAFS